MSEQFEAGQTVWGKHTGLKASILAIHGDKAWVEYEPSQAANDLVGKGPQTVPLEVLLATDPNQPAELVPQACPMCGAKPIIHTNLAGISSVYCSEGTNPEKFNCLRGPQMPTRLEAIQAWNSIRVDEQTDRLVCLLIAANVAKERDEAAKLLESDYLIGLVYHLQPEHVETVKSMRRLLANAIRNGKR